MPQSSRLLYYDLGMAADDDGIVEAFSVIRSTGATEDDLRVLSARKFVTVLNDDLVSYINEWHENNYIRPDRYTPSIYAELLVKVADLLPKTIAGLPNDNQLPTAGLPNDNHCRPQDRTGKSKRKMDRGASAPMRKRFTPPTIEELNDYIREKGYAISPQRFMNFYEANGWKVGRNPMRDWKAAVRSWAGREQQAAERQRPAAGQALPWRD